MKEGHIWIDNVINENTHLDVKRQIEANNDSDVIVLHIQSPGGSVYGGYNTYHVLKSSGKKIKTIIEGEAQSMATFIALAGDEIEIRNPSVFMIHNPSSGMEGDADMLQSGASELRNIENDMAEAYSRKTGIQVDKVKEMMKATTVLNARQAVELKFADRVIDPLRAVAIGKTKNMENKLQEAFQSFKAKMEAVINEVLPKAEPAPVSMPLPAGEYVLEDGRVIVVDETGMVIVKEGVPGESEEMKKLKEEMAAVKAENETLKATAAQIEAVKAEAEEKVTKSAQALGTLKEQFEELKKMTIGEDKAPKAAATFKKEPVANTDENGWGALRSVILNKVQN